MTCPGHVLYKVRETKRNVTRPQERLELSDSNPRHRLVSGQPAMAGPVSLQRGYGV